jgi:hypothetical protein
MNELPKPKLVTGYVAYLLKDGSFYGKYNKFSEFKAAAISGEKNPDDFSLIQILGSGQDSEKKVMFLSQYSFRNKIDLNIKGLILEEYKWCWEPPFGKQTEFGIEVSMPKKQSTFNYYFYKVSFWFSNLFKFL